MGLMGRSLQFEWRVASGHNSEELQHQGIQLQDLPLSTHGGLPTVSDSNSDQDQKVNIYSVQKGWNTKGIKRFNKLYDHVAQDRRDNLTSFPIG